MSCHSRRFHTPRRPWATCDGASRSRSSLGRECAKRMNTGMTACRSRFPATPLLREDHLARIASWSMSGVPPLAGLVKNRRSWSGFRGADSSTAARSGRSLTAVSLHGRAWRSSASITGSVARLFRPSCVDGGQERAAWQLQLAGSARGSALGEA
jgi:hypothetical protein